METQMTGRQYMPREQCTLEREAFCTASPKTLNVALIGSELGYKHLESHFAYVHGTLTWEIAVFEKVQGAEL
jgi:hypothetical protein